VKELSNEEKEQTMSRQIYALGKETQQKISRASVLIVGLGGLGIETAKNLVLMGVKVLGISDSRPLCIEDCATNFAVGVEDVGKPRDEASRNYLARLSISSEVRVVPDAWNADVVNEYSVVVLTDCISESAAIKMNEMCRASKNGTKFIWADSRGVSAFVFDDFGEKHEVTDKDGEVPLPFMVAHITQDEKGGVVSLVEQGRLQFAVDDLVRFIGVEKDSMHELNDLGAIRVTEVNGKYTLRVETDTSKMNPFRGSCYIESVKKHEFLRFEPLSEKIRNPGEMVETDWSKMGSGLQGLLAYRTLWSIADGDVSKIPRVHNADDSKQFLEKMQQLNSQDHVADSVSEEYARIFSMTAACEMPTVVTFLGGVVCQEALKACSGKYTPVTQWMFYDAMEALPDKFEEMKESEFVADPDNKKYAKVVGILGRELHDKLRNLKVFVVGAGAIGCEVLKTMAQLGIATGPDGMIHLTDLDTIERSDLSRQFLFRSGDIGKLKSETAAHAIERMYPGIHMKAMSIRVGPETEDVFTNDFFRELDCVISALDNVKARRYIDSRCVDTCRPFLDSGTLGPKGSTQDVVPHLTESYSSSNDPPEPTIPFCILHNFPNLIDHTIEWARDKFHGLFADQPEVINNYAEKGAGVVETLDENLRARSEALQTLYHNLVEDRPKTIEDCVRWARLLFEDYFVITIKKLLFSFPPDSVTSEGLLFWLPPKKCPVPLSFDAKNDDHRGFIEAAANLRAFNFGIKQMRNMTPGYVEATIAGMKLPEFVGEKKQTLDENGNLKEDDMESGSEQEIQAIIAKLPDAKSLGKHPVNPVVFEKDDFKNYHMAFIHTCSNLRATNYHIPTVEFADSIGIAGRIIPAMISTTAAVSGLQITELVKIVQKKPLECYKNAYINLALPLITFCEPVPCPVQKIREGWTFTMWDKLTVQGDITLDELCKLFETKYKISIEMVSCGTAMIFSSFVRGERRKKRLQQRVTEAFKEVTKEEIPPETKVVPLVITCTDSETGEDLEDFPLVEYVLP